MVDTDILSQAEIDALLGAVSTGSLPERPAQATEVLEEVEPFDLSADRQSYGGYVQSLEGISQRFLHEFRPRLFPLLRQYTELERHPLRLIGLSDFLQSLPVPVSINFFRPLPLRGKVVIAFEPDLIETIFDGFFGGRRTPAAAERKGFTRSETRLIGKVLSQTTASLQKAWSPIIALDFELVYSETNPRYALVTQAGPAELLGLTSFELSMGGDRGAFHIGWPVSALEPLRDRLTATIQDSDGEPDRDSENRLRANLLRVNVEVISMLTRAVIPLRDLMSLKVGDVVPVEIPPTVSLSIESLPLYRGRYGVSEGRRAIQILDRADDAQP
jgi:flagellar motor switch protein FliM